MDKLPKDYEYPDNRKDGMPIDNYQGHALEASDMDIGDPNWGYITRDQQKPHAPTPPKMKRSMDANLSKVLMYLEDLEEDIDYIKKIVQRLRG